MLRIRPQEETFLYENYYPDTRPVTYTRGKPKIGRNNPCPCGSGKKFKKCCGKN
jgi:uncharacterized protein YecA (UPF0149 family)